VPKRDLGIGWSAQFVRLTVFPLSPQDLDSLSFESITGTPPDSQENRLKELLRLEVGPFANGKLEVRVSPLRADVLYTPKLPEVGPPLDISAFQLEGTFPEQLVTFTDAVTPCLTLPTQLSRIALGTKMVAFSEDHVSAYEILRKCLRSVSVDPERMRDLTYRVNWRVDCQLPGVPYMNRLTTWNAFHSTLVASSAAASERQLIQERYAAQLELDINTPRENSADISVDTRVLALKRMLDLAMENLRFGEVISNA